MWTLCSAVQRFIFTHLDFFLSDKISSTNPRVIEDQRARQLCIDVRHSLFYETCATYGFNVDRVFAEGEFHHSSIRIVWLNMRNHYNSVTDYCWQLVDWSSFNGLCFFFPAAQKIITQKKQAALQACKSLPNSPSHSGGSTPGSASFPSQVNASSQV